MSAEVFGDDEDYGIPAGYVSDEIYGELEGEYHSAMRVLRHAHMTLKEAKANPEKASTFIDSVLENTRWWLDQNVAKQSGESWRVGWLACLVRGSNL